MIFIAELCQNHNGDFEILKDMIYAAKESGADYVKIQNIFADMLSHRKKFDNGLEENGVTKVIKRPYDLEYARLKKLELSYDQQAQFIEICEKAGVKPLTTVFTRDSVNKIKELGFKNIKIASYDCASYPLLRDIKCEFDRIFISTGATYDHEVEKMVSIMSGVNYSLLHCVTVYPTPLNLFNLARLNYLRKFSKLVGWSDHSSIQENSIFGTLVAIYYGADIIERHFTILPNDQTKDGPVSINPKQLKDLVEKSKLDNKQLLEYLKKHNIDYEKCYGTSNRDLSDIELLNRDYFRGRFVSKLDSKEIYNWESFK